jgi:Na+/alanine symporter
MFSNPIFYGALMILWLVAFPGFLIFYCVSGIGNVMSVVVPAAACLLILGTLGAIIIAQ